MDFHISTRVSTQDERKQEELLKVIDTDIFWSQPIYKKHSNWKKRAAINIWLAFAIFPLKATPAPLGENNTQKKLKNMELV